MPKKPLHEICKQAKGLLRSFLKTYRPGKKINGMVFWEMGEYIGSKGIPQANGYRL